MRELKENPMKKANKGGPKKKANRKAHDIAAPEPGFLEPLTRMERDTANAATTLSANEARFLVDAYYNRQDERIRAHNQVRALAGSGEPHDVVHWLEGQTGLLGKQGGRRLNFCSARKPLGQWARSIVGIGPIISAGLLAHIDIGKCETAGAIWSFAGLNPDAEWAKGQKRPWNADLKKICWKIGESFVKTS